MISTYTYHTYTVRRRVAAKYTSDKYTEYDRYKYRCKCKYEYEYEYECKYDMVGTTMIIGLSTSASTRTSVSTRTSMRTSASVQISIIMSVSPRGRRRAATT